MCKSICRPSGFARSSGTVNVPHWASTCRPVDEVSEQSSREIEGSGSAGRFEVEQEVRNIKKRKGI